MAKRRSVYNTVAVITICALLTTASTACGRVGARASSDASVTPSPSSVSSSPSPTASPTPSPAPTGAPVPPPVIAVTSVKEGGSVGVTQTITGTARNISNNYRLWAVIQPEASPNFHPQPGPIAVTPAGTWSVSCTFGEPSQVGFKFSLLLVLTNAEGTRQFNGYLLEATRRGAYPGLTALPSGTTRYVRLHLVRK